MLSLILSESCLQDLTQALQQCGKKEKEEICLLLWSIMDLY